MWRCSCCRSGCSRPRSSGHVAERYLITTIPPLAIGLCAWISRGAPRPRAVLIGVGALLVLGAAAIPIAEIAAPETLVNAPTTAILGALSADWARAVLVLGACLGSALVLFLPRRFAWVTAAVVALGLTVASVDSARRIADASAREQRAAEGSIDADWLDAAEVGDATLLETGDRLWTATARTIFWNRRIRDVVRVAPAATPVPARGWGRRPPR